MKISKDFIIAVALGLAFGAIVWQQAELVNLQRSVEDIRDAVNHIDPSLFKYN